MHYFPIYTKLAWHGMLLVDLFHWSSTNTYIVRTCIQIYTYLCIEIIFSKIEKVRCMCTFVGMFVAAANAAPYLLLCNVTTLLSLLKWFEKRACKTLHACQQGCWRWWWCSPCLCYCWCWWCIKKIQRTHCLFSFPHWKVYSICNIFTHFLTFPFCQIPELEFLLLREKEISEAQWVVGMSWVRFYVQPSCNVHVI